MDAKSSSAKERAIKTATSSSPEGFRLVLKTYLLSNPENRYLFESRQRTKFSTRRIQQNRLRLRGIGRNP